MAPIKTLPSARPESCTENPKAIISPPTCSSMLMRPPKNRTSPVTRARELMEPARTSSSPCTGAAVTTEPPVTERSPATGAVITTEMPARYAFPGEELAARSERATEKDAGADAASVLAGRRKISAMRSARCIPMLDRRRPMERASADRFDRYSKDKNENRDKS